MLVQLECSAVRMANRGRQFCRLTMLGEWSQHGPNHSDEFHQVKVQSFTTLMIDLCWVAV